MAGRPSLEDRSGKSNADDLPATARRAGRGAAAPVPKRLPLGRRGGRCCLRSAGKRRTFRQPSLAVAEGGRRRGTSAAELESRDRGSLNATLLKWLPQPVAQRARYSASRLRPAPGGQGRGRIALPGEDGADGAAGVGCSHDGAERPSRWGNRNWAATGGRLASTDDRAPDRAGADLVGGVRGLARRAARIGRR